LYEKTANQNTVLKKYFVLIGQFWSMSTNHEFKSFVTLKLGMCVCNEVPVPY